MIHIHTLKRQSPFRMKISMIVAASENQVIGVGNDLPWRLPDDMKFFVKTTKGHHILCGRKNLESFGKLLPKRTNLILTRDQNFRFEGAEIFQSIDEAIAFAKDNGENELMVIGGGEIYKQVLPQTDCIYLTRVHTKIDGDTYFPKLDPEVWEEHKGAYHPVDERHAHAFTFYKYTRKA